jgi:hypothetical protein
MMSVQVRATSHLNCWSMDYKILKPDGSELAARSNYVPVNAPGLMLFDSVTLPTAGTYTLYADRGHIETGAITLKLFKDTPPNVAGTVTADGSTSTLTTSIPMQRVNMTFRSSADQVAGVRLRYSTGMDLVSIGYNTLKPDGSRPDDRSNWRPIVLPGVVLFNNLTLPTGGTYSLYADPGDIEASATTLVLR